MPSAPIPAKSEWLRAAETLAIATVGALALNGAGFPAGLVTGSRPDIHQPNHDPTRPCSGWNGEG